MGNIRANMIASMENEFADTTDLKRRGRRLICDGTITKVQNNSYVVFVFGLFFCAFFLSFV